MQMHMSCCDLHSTTQCHCSLRLAQWGMQAPVSTETKGKRKSIGLNVHSDLLSMSIKPAWHSEPKLLQFYMTIIYHYNHFKQKCSTATATNALLLMTTENNREKCLLEPFSHIKSANSQRTIKNVCQKLDSIQRLTPAIMRNLPCVG